MIVGVAYVENSTPRSVSKRSIDLISPIVPTWTRSSKRLAAVAEPAGAVLDQRQVQVHQRVARRGSRSASEAVLVAEHREELRAALPGQLDAGAGRRRVRVVPRRRLMSEAGSGVAPDSMVSVIVKLVVRRRRRRRWSARVVSTCQAKLSWSGVERSPSTVDRDARPSARRARGEAAGQVGAGRGLGQHHRAGLADRDPQVLDVVDR